MNRTKKSIIATSMSLLLCTSLFADEVYTLKKDSLENTIKKISKISNMTYMIDKRILKNKISPAITNITGTEAALKEILKDTGLEAVIKKDTIIIKKIQTKNEEFSAVLSTIYIESMEEDDITKGYVQYEDASITRNNATLKETPQTINTLNIEKNKNYGTTDLTSILQGVAGVTSVQDARADNIYIRGFTADGSDIYRDGIRESGQVHRSTANIERIEIMKGPASLLYGRSNGGGVINMVSKYANFGNTNNVGVTLGSYDKASASLDINQQVSENVAARIVAEIGKSGSHRDSLQEELENKSTMISPSVTVNINDNMTWTGQYTYDTTERDSDRGPSKSEYEKMGISGDKAFHHNGDYINDKLQILRSSLDYSINNNLNLKWNLAYREAEQNFANFYNGSYDESTKLLTQSYSWQETEFNTLSNALTLNAEVEIGGFLNRLTTGIDYSKEERNNDVKYESDYATFNPYDSSSWNNSVDIDSLSNQFDRENDGITYGLFLEDIIEFHPQFKLILGARFDKYKFESLYKTKDAVGSYSGDSFSPRIGMVYDINNDHTLYASYNKSFSPYGGQSYLGINATTDPDEYNDQPEYNEQYEVGMKSDWLDGKLNTTLSLYQITHFNERYQPDNNDPEYWAVKGEERSEGVELNIIGQVHEGIYVRSSLGLMNAKVIENKDEPEEEGRFLENTARVNGNIFVRYAPSNQPFYGEAGVTYVGDRYDYDNGKEDNLGSYSKVDALFGWKYNSQTNITLAVSNLFDEDYWSSSRMTGTPRSFTARLNYKF